MTPTTCRWGILGAANIARKNWKAIRNAGNSSLTAVASRDLGRAQKWIDECQSHTTQPKVPIACGSYEELLKRSDIDAVYIPLPTGIRPEWVIRAAEAKKHILCEKPCGTTIADVRTMLDACHKNNVQFMDGVMFMHSSRLPLLRQVLDDDTSIGSIRRIVSQFSFLGPAEFMQQNIRVSHELEPLGALGDLGWYNIRFSLWAMKNKLPERVSGRILGAHGRSDSEQAVPTEFSAEMLYPDGVSASFYCSFLSENQQWASVSGTKGFLHVPDFVLPFYGCESEFEVNHSAFVASGCDFNMERHATRHAVAEYSNSTANSQETNMIRNFADIVLSGKIEPMWGEIALKTQQVLDACLASAREDGKLRSVS
ncbi:MAG: Gfo/Idh/MocA family oxidoreductase [Planctomycetes bacterium]|nr:Gfo/Idh/MocA family oxidoreductase [Planctomycetota bacterium]